MTLTWRCWWWKLWLALLAMGGALASCGDCLLAQIIPDGTLGAESSVVTPTNIDGLPTDQIDGGATRGANLFHSFEQFSVPTGSAAYFNNAPNIQNIISRVTGSSISNIDGLIRANGTANLFLLNPNGIIVGPNASLNIGGSFVGSTASSINFADGTQFSATAHPSTLLLTVSVPIGLQYGGTNPGSIRNLSRVTNSSGETVGLQVQPGKTLALVGGDVNLDDGFLTAPGGRIELGGSSGAGTLGLNVDSNNLSLSYPEQVQRASVSLTNGAEADVTAGGGGSLAVTARNLDLMGGSTLRAGIRQDSGAVGSQAGNVEINATGAVTASGSNIFNTVQLRAEGNSGDINVTTGSLSFTNGSQLSSSTLGQGNAGSVTISAGNISFDGGYAFSTVESGAVGNGGEINITTGLLSMTNGAQLIASTHGQGDSGSVFVQATDSVSLADASILNTVDSGAVGNGGEINITAGSLSLTDGAQLLTSIREDSEILPSGSGNAGNVNIEVRDHFTMANAYNDRATQISSDVSFGAVGNGGSISVKAGSLSLTNAALTASTFGQGNAGSVNINARDTVSFDGGYAFSTVAEGAEGNGGDINITTGSLTLTNGAALSVSTYEQGHAGSVNINARDTVSFDGGYALSPVAEGAKGNGGDINITTGLLFVTNGAQLVTSTLDRGNAGSVNINARDTVSFDESAAASAVQLGAVGNGGGINITTGSLSVTNGSGLFATTSGQGNAGSVTINARDTVSFDESAAASTVESGGMGNGGGVNITAGSLSVTNGAALSASTRGQGDAGSVNINARDTVSFDGVSSNGFSSAAFSRVESRAVGNGGSINITTGSLTLTNGAGLTVSSEGNGAAGNIEVAADSIRLENLALLSSDTIAGQGNIILRSGNLVLRHGSNITTNATGTASGGNITIDTNVLAALENSDITAKASEGLGGRIIINAQGIFGTQFRDAETSESDITASSRLGPQFSGTVEINTPDVDPSQGLATLPAELVEASGLIAQGCAADAENKFIVTGRGGLPPNPGDTLSGEAVLTNWATLDPEVENRSGVAPSTNSTSPTPTQIVEAQGWLINNKGEVVLTANAPNVTPNIPWMTPAQCHAPETSS